MILWGRPKGSRAPPLDQGNRRRDCALVPRVLRQGLRPPPSGLGKRDAVLGRRELGKEAFSRDP